MAHRKLNLNINLGEIQHMGTSSWHYWFGVVPQVFFQNQNPDQDEDQDQDHDFTLDFNTRPTF